jgi:hypothetical protein
MDAAARLESVSCYDGRPYNAAPCVTRPRYIRVWLEIGAVVILLAGNCFMVAIKTLPANLLRGTERVN